MSALVPVATAKYVASTTVAPSVNPWVLGMLATGMDAPTGGRSTAGPGPFLSTRASRRVPSTGVPSSSVRRDRRTIPSAWRRGRW
jgi:hypothetical protein